MRLYPIGNYNISLTDDHKLPEILCANPFYDRYYSFILDYFKRKTQRDWVVDIGANVGDTAAYIATHINNPILCVEGAEVYIPHLRHNAKLIGNQVRLIEKFVSIPAIESRKMEYHGGAGTGVLTINSDNASSKMTVAEDRFIKIDDIIKQAESTGDSVGLIKTDTDGLDAYIVKELIEKTDSIIFYECDEINTLALDVNNPTRANILKMMDLGYDFIVFENYGLPVACVDSSQAEVIIGILDWIKSQYCIGTVRVHYLDVWAFPPKWSDIYQSSKTLIQKGQFYGQASV